MTGGTSSGDLSLRYRLPYSVSPRRYRLHLAPDLETETFTGTVAIEAVAHEQLHSITLHAQELSITSARVTSGGQAMEPSTRDDVEHDDRIVLELPRPVPAGALEIEIAFGGKLLEQLSGFYLSSYTDAAGERRSLAVTQFEATDARRAFPCFDEPDRKAVFSVSVDVPPGMAACSNSPVASERPGPGGGSTVTFADTIPMSTYLVALVVGPLVRSEAVEVLGTPVRVVHVPGREHLTGFALEVASHALRFFTEWFGLAYPAQKLDLVAVPDFAFGAMENLGCVVFREATLLVDIDRASRMDLVRVADVVSHEIAHMWFGDLVTMKWWNGIWLNEAFASFMEIAAVDDFRPEWERWVDFGVERDSAMATDALDSTRPIEYPVGPPEDAQGMFDVLTYQKGAGVLRMLESYLGPDTFRNGIRRYLVRHQLSNTETGDLWDAIEQESNEPVRRIMDSWIFQGGFPLVTADRHDHALALRREPFRYGPAHSHSAIGDGWPVPVLARRLGRQGTERLLVEDDPVELATAAPAVVNAGGWGFYRVTYDPASLAALAGRCAELEILERYNLLSDTWASLVAGRAGLAGFLHLAEAMRRDPEAGVWRTITGALEFLDRAADDETRALVAGYARALVGPSFAALGWERTSGEGERTATLRAELLRCVGGVGADPEVQRECLARFAAAGDGGVALDPDLAPSVLAVVARAGGRREFDEMIAGYRDPPTPQEGVRFLQNLGRFEDAELAGRAFRIATTEARTQDGPFVISILLANRAAGEDTWAKVEDDWNDLQARFPANIFPHMLEAVRLLFRNPETVTRVQRFLADHEVPTGQRTVEQAVERLRVNHALGQRLIGSLGDDLSAGIDRLSPA